jgi:hypothetical protein
MPSIKKETNGKDLQKQAGKLLADANKMAKKSKELQKEAGKLLSQGNKIEKSKK